MTSHYFRELGKKFSRLLRFLRRNLHDLRSLNGSSFRRKLASLTRVHLPQVVRLTIGFPIGLVGVTLIRILKPVALIRIGSINTTRLGHMLIDVEMATAEREIGRNTNHPRTIDLWFPWTRGLKPANEQLLKMWKRSVPICPAWVLEPIAEINKLVPGGAVHEIPYRKESGKLSNFNDIHGALRTTRPHLKFTNEEVELCEVNMRELGMSSGDKFVCLHVRTSDYLSKRLGKENSSGHDFRDAQVSDHLDAMLMLANQGYKVLRMGTETEFPLEISHPNFIDYACSGRRSELMDLYLPSRCEFFVGVLSGPSHIAQLFRRPLLLTNLVPLSRMMLSMDNFLFIPKAIVDSEGNCLSLRAIVDTGLEDLSETVDYVQRGLRVVDNTASEILEAVEEMALRVSGQFREGENELSARSRFMDLVPDYLKVGAGTGTIACSYLSSNPWFIN